MHAPTLLRLLILLLALGIAWFIRGQLIESSHRRLEEHQWVKLIDEPPPPPPKQEPLPEPEPIPEPEEPQLKEEEIAQPEENKESSDDALGADEEGRAGSDSFGIRSKKGGKDLLQTGPSGNQGPAVLAYGGEVVGQIQRNLASDKKLREKHYVAFVSVWVNAQGRIERIEFDQSTGHPELDQHIIHVLTSHSRSFRAPPPGMPQPLKIRLTSKPPIG